MIISLVTILMVLSETIEENEVEWFFQNGGNKGINERFETQFLGWKMGSASGTSKDRRKNKTPGPDEEDEKELTDFFFSDLSIKTSPTWRTLILANSTIHYIPLEDMATVKPSINSIPDDALDPFYLENDLQSEIFNNELINSQYIHKIPTQIPPHNGVKRPNVITKKNSKNSIMFCPLGLSLQKKAMPLLKPCARLVQHPVSYQGKSKIEPGLLPEINRHTMFIHPKLLDMMKAMDRSILSYPSKFEYKSLDQMRTGSKRFQPNRYNDRFVI